MACLHFNHPSSRAQTVCTVTSSRPTFCFRACDVPLDFLSGQGKSTRTTKIHFNNSRDALSYLSSLLSKHSRTLKKTQDNSEKNSNRASDINATLEMPVYQKELANKIHETIQQNGKWEDVINLKPQDLEPDLVVEVLRLQARAQDALRFFNWADRQEGYEHNTDVYYTILSILVRASMLDEMLSILKKMKSERLEITKSMLNGVIHKFGMSGKLQETEETFNLMEELGHKPGLTAYNSLLTVLMKYRIFDRAEILFDKMAQNGVLFNGVTYTLKIQLVCSTGTKQAAFDTLNQMVSEGFAPNVVSFTIVISFLCKLGEIKRAYEVFRLMHAYKCEPNVYTYNTLIKGLISVASVEECLQLVKTMEQKGFLPNIYTYTVLIDGFCKLRDLHRANEMFQEALAKGLKPNTVTYNALISGHVLNGRWDEVRDIYKAMQENGCSPDSISYNYMIQGLVKKEQVSQALSIYNEAKEKGFKINLHSLYVLTRGLNRIGNHKDASIFFRRLKEVGHLFDANDYFLGVMSHSKVRAMDEAVGLLHEMISRDLTPNHLTYNMVIKGFCRQRRMEDAKAILNLMIEKNTVPTQDTYNILINEFLWQRRTEEANQLYISALDKGVIPSWKRDVYRQV